MRTYDDFRICNCAACDCEMLGESEREFVTHVMFLHESRQLLARHAFVGGRVNGRPYCEACMKELKLSGPE